MEATAPLSRLLYSRLLPSLSRYVGIDVLTCLLLTIVSILAFIIPLCGLGVQGCYCVDKFVRGSLAAFPRHQVTDVLLRTAKPFGYLPLIHAALEDVDEGCFNIHLRNIQQML